MLISGAGIEKDTGHLSIANVRFALAGTEHSNKVHNKNPLQISNQS